MKEAERGPNNLTREPQTPYSKGGDIFMEGKPDMAPQNSQPTNPEHAEKIPAQKQPPRGLPPVAGGAQEPGEPTAEAAGAGQGGEKPPVSPPLEPQAAGAGREGEGGNRIPTSTAGQEELSKEDGVGNGEKGPSFTDITLISILEGIVKMDQKNPLYSEFLRDQIRRIQGLQDTNKVNLQEAWRLQESLYLKLGEMMQSQAREDISQASAINKIRNINRDKSDQERERETIEALRDISTSEGLRTELIDSIMEYDNALEYLVNRIISEPLDAETSGYQLSFYGGINFALIRDRMRVVSERYRREAFNKGEVSSQPEPERPITTKAESKEGLALKFEFMRSGAELLHNMNWKIVTGDIEQFVGVARGITVEHLQVLQRVKYAATVMRLYEQELQNVISRDGKITPENYAEVAGTILDKKGNPTGKIPGSVEKLLVSYNESLPENERLESWQLKWAFYSGRNMINITLRAAELIAQSKEMGYRSYVQEAASRIIDPLTLTAERFGIAEPRGGVHFLAMVKNIFHEDKKRFGWMESGIKTLMGGDRKEFEARGIFNITGVWSSWRENNIVQIWDPNNIKERISIETLMKRKGPLAEEINPMTGKKKGNEVALREIFLDEKGELRPEFCHSLGIMLKLGDIVPSDKDSQEILTAKRKVRTAIWRRVAKENPLAMVNFMRGMRFEEGKEPSGSVGINVNLVALDKLMFTEETKFDEKLRWSGGKEKRDILVGKYKETDTWSSLRKKLAVVHETRMKKLSEGNLMSLEEVIKDLKLDFPGDEGKIFEELRKLGEIVAPKMAEVRFPSNAFMNDVLLEDALYTQAGAEFFRRRLGGDIPKFYEAGGEFPQLMDNPGGIAEEEALKVIAKMERALESPNGTESGQDDVSPVFQAYLEFIEAGGNTENVPGFVKFLVQESLLGISIGRMMKKRNSWAQVYSGPGAPAEDIYETSKTLDNALKMGILRRGTGRSGEAWTDLYDRFRKKFKAKPIWFILRFIFDAFPIFAAGMFFDIGQKSVKEKG